MNFFTRKNKNSQSVGQNADMSAHVEPLAHALEPRIMFDGAAVATGADVMQDADGNQDSTGQGHHVVVVDTSVKDYQKLLEAIAPEATLVLIQGDENGLDVLLTALDDMAPVDTLHIISHGDAGGFSLGADSVTASNLDTHAGTLAALGQKMTENGDILLYGCDIAGDAVGVQFVDDLAVATGADVAASDDLTGNTDKGGDWDLEVVSGEVTTDTPFSAAALKSYEHVLAVESFESGWSTTATDTLSGSMFGLNFVFSGSTTEMVAYAINNGSKASAGTHSLNLAYLAPNGGGGTAGSIVLERDTSGLDWTINGFKVTYTAEDLTIKAYLNNTELTLYQKTVTGGSGVTEVSWAGGLLVDKLVFSCVDGVGTNIYIDEMDGSAPGPSITDATYDAATGSLVVSGSGFNSTGGASNDVDASKLTITGEGGQTYTLTNTSDVEITSATQFTLTLSATDKSALNQMLNKNGASSTSGTTYDVDGAAGFIVESPSTADTDANAVTVSNVSAPAITSASYDYSTNTVTVTGTGFVHKTGANNDVDLSKLTFTGEGGQTYTITSVSDVEIADDTSFSFTLTGADIVGVESLLNKDGSSSDDMTTYNIAGAAGFIVGDSTTAADLTSGVTVGSYAVPTVDSATFDYTTGVLVVAGSNFVAKNGASNDVDVSLLAFVGEGGEQYQLTSGSDVEVTSSTSYTITLSGVDLANVRGLLNKNGTTSATSGTAFSLVSLDNWMAGSPDLNNVADAGATITVSNVVSPTVTSAAYDYATNVLTVTGTNFVANSGALNDVDVSTITLTGEGGTSYTLTSGTDVEIIDATTFAITLSGADLVNVESILNKNGTTSATTSTVYNIAVADNWMTQSPSTTDISDTTGNAVNVSNYAAPAITDAAYDWGIGQFVFNATNLVGATGVNNDIDASLFTITGENGSTYTLQSSSDVDVTSATSFTITLSAADKLAVNGLLNKNGTTSGSGTTFNVAAADNWATGAPAANNIADASSGVNVSNYVAPTITSASYDYSTNSLTVSGSNFVAKSGANNDIDISTLTFTGEGGATYTLSSATDVEVTSETSFTITLTGADIVGVESLLNQDGTISVGGTTFNLAAADNWMAGADANIDVADALNGITVSNYSMPTVTSATFQWGTGQLVVSGEDFVAKSGASNDIDVSLLTFTGAGGTYTLTDSSDVEVTSATSFSVNLSSTDLMNIRGLLNKNGISAGDNTTYNIAFADNWAAGAPDGLNIADLSGNVVTVSGVGAPTITSATYDSDTGVLTVSGANLFKRLGADNDVDISQITLTGGVGGATYVITSASDVEITSDTSFTLTLTGADKTNVDALLDQVGTSSTSGTTYNISVGDDWLTGADAALNIADATNPVTVSISPKITSATYDASTGHLVVTGSNIQSNGGGLDIDASQLTLTGEGGETYTLTDTSDVNISSGTEFTLVLSATDKAALNQIINKAGTVSTGGTVFGISAADDWNTNVTAGDTSDMTGNGVTASNIGVPTITGAAYDALTGVVVLSGENFTKFSGAGNDIDASLLTFTGEGGETYTLSDTSDVEITNGTSASVTLSSTDRAALNQIMNKDGTTSTGATTYLVTAGEDWAKGADSAVDVAETVGKAVTVSNVALPSLSSATYDHATGILTLTGANLTKASGLANDIIANKLTLTGEGGTTYTLTDTSNVDITNATTATLTLSATDRAVLGQIMNLNGAAASDTTTYNIAAADNWAAGADAALTIQDATGNGVTVSNVAAPTITSATYDNATGNLVLTGTNFVKSSGPNNDISADKLTLIGEGRETYTLTDTADVEITNGTTATLTLSATDQAVLHQIFNKAGTSATGGQTYGVSAADNWMTGGDATADIADTTGNGVTVSNVTKPTIDSATYDASTGTLVLTGQNFVKLTGAGNDIDASLFTFTGEGGETYTLTDTSDVDITRATTATLTLSATDRAALGLIINSDGFSSTGGEAYKISAAEDWAKGADSAVVVVDNSGNNVDVSNVATPTITSASYDNTTGQLTINGSNFSKLVGAANDIIANTITITGQNLQTYTLTDTVNVDIENATTAVLTLSATDKAGVEALLDTSGVMSSDGTTYNIALADDWAAGAAASLLIGDATNDLTANITQPSSDFVPSGSSGGQTDLTQDEDGFDSLGLAGDKPLLGDGMAGFIGNPPAGQNIRSVTTGQVLGVERTLGFTSRVVAQDPSAGVEAMSIVRNAVTGNDRSLNSFYGASSNLEGGGVGDGGLGGQAGQAGGLGGGLGTGWGFGGFAASGAGQGEPQGPAGDEGAIQPGDPASGLDGAVPAAPADQQAGVDGIETDHFAQQVKEADVLELTSFSTQIAKMSVNPEMTKLEKALGV